MRVTRSRTTALLTAAGATLAVAASIYAPVAAADDTIACEPGQIVIDDNCNIPAPVPVDDFAPPPSDFGGNSVDIGGGGVDIATGGVDIGGGGIDVGGGHH